MRKLTVVFLAQGLLVLAGCGGGGSGMSTSTSNNGSGGPPLNTVAITVDSGPAASSFYDVDMPFVTVTVCAPGSMSNCQQIDHVEVDTGSYGLRIISSVLTSSLASALQQEQGAGGNAVVECTQFVDGFSWGPMKLADVRIGNESASALPIQVIGDPAYASEIPTGCSSKGTAENTVAAFGANGVLGLGPFGSDCGSYCANTTTNGWYYLCPANGTSTASCTESTVSMGAQATNPVVHFQTDNNGVIVEMPAVADGAKTASGTLVFGIGTESNNSLSGQTVLTANGYGDVSTTYTSQGGQQEFLPYSYFDTGSNAYYFSDAGIPSVQSCSSYPGYNSTSPDTWFCPSSELSLSANNSGQNGTQSTVALSIANAYTLFNTNPSATVFTDLGASSGALSSNCTSQSTASGDTSCAFDFGFPFFIGRNVYIAIGGANTSWGTGPYFAY